LRGTVQFAKGLETIQADKKAVLLEVGPGQVLTTLAKRSFELDNVVATARHAKEQRNDVESFLQAVGQLWLEGVVIDWALLHGDNPRRRIALPTYQFERQTYWVGGGETREAADKQDLADVKAKGVVLAKTADEYIATIWQKAFGVDKISPQDNFFELGGDSLLATQLIAHIRQQLNVQVSLSELFESANLGEFTQLLKQRAENIDEQLSACQGIERVAPDVANRDKPFPMTDIQQAYWVGRTSAVELGDVATHIYLEVDIKSGDVSQFQRGWNQLIVHHDMLRAIFLDSGEQQILPSVPLYIFDIIDLRGMDEDAAKAREMALRDQMSHQVLPCDSWPLFDIKAAKRSDSKFRLCISIDILIVDAWSMNMLIEQWLYLYRDADFKLRELSFSFRDYVIAETALRETELYYQSEEYWFDRIESLPAAPALPLAMAPSAIKEVKFERLDYEMAADRWDALQQKALRIGVTPTSLLITAFSEVLALWCQSPRFTLNLTNYSRHPFHDDADFIVGDFTSLTLLEIFNDSDKSFGDNAKQVQQQLFRDLDNRYVSAIHVLREMGKRRSGRVSMPVVFTSTLGGRALDHEDTADELGEEVFGVSQTSQVWLD
ncbi:MAG: hypothetical protein HRT35_38520, partial [Algicola sp.]|nr:hypothetical protein [Algicola sp.]